MDKVFATRDTFLSKSVERRYKEASLWDGSAILIRSMNEAEFSKIDVENVDTSKGGLSRDGMRLSNVRLFIGTVCNANPEAPGYKEAMFKDSDQGALLKADTIWIEPVIREIREHCGLRQDVEDILKNFATTLADDSHSSSAEPLPSASTSITS